MNSNAAQIYNRILKKGQGWVFKSEDFIDIADKSSVSKSLSYLAKKNKIRRIIRGIY